MTNRDRVYAAINHKQPDYTPFQIDFTNKALIKVAEYLGDNNFIEKINNHIDMAEYSGNLYEISKGSDYWKDDFGVVWNRSGVDKDIGVIDGLIFNEPDIHTYKFPVLDEKRLRKEYEKMICKQNGNFKFGHIGFSLFERAWTLRGMENLLMDMVAEPVFVDALLDAITDYNLKIIDIGLEYEIDGFFFGDDWDQQKGLIMGPKFWRRFLKPRLAQMYGRIKSRGKAIAQHCCGDIHEIFPDLIEIGLDIYQTFQPEIYDVQKIKNEYGEHLTFWGGISTQRLLPFATPNEIKKVIGCVYSITIRHEHHPFFICFITALK